MFGIHITKRMPSTPAPTSLDNFFIFGHREIGFRRINKQKFLFFSPLILHPNLGWYHGERIRDGAQGWFPGNHTEEVASPHVRARNLKQRYRLLTFTAAYYESQKKK